LRKLGKLTGEPSAAIITKIKQNTANAIKIARKFGAHDASKFISSDITVTADEESDGQKPDKKQILLQILQDISNHISGDIDLNQLFEMVLEGIHRGVEMDRTLFLLLSPDKRTLNEKISLGWHKHLGEQKVHVHNNEVNSNLCFYALHHEEGLWIDPQHYQALFTAQIMHTIGRNKCFIFPVYVEHKPIGLIYTDRGINNAPLNQDDFTAAKHFARQANIGLTLYTIKKH
jgi:transcriptional regulator with GAF, ATPase, and Fis domain